MKAWHVIVWVAGLGALWALLMALLAIVEYVQSASLTQEYEPWQY